MSHYFNNMLMNAFGLFVKCICSFFQERVFMKFEETLNLNGTRGNFFLHQRWLLCGSLDATWVFPKIVLPPKWMVKIMENPMNKWMIWEENPLFSETPTWQSTMLCYAENVRMKLQDPRIVNFSEKNPGNLRHAYSMVNTLEFLIGIYTYILIYVQTYIYHVYTFMNCLTNLSIILLMEEILHQLRLVINTIFKLYNISQVVVWDSEPSPVVQSFLLELSGDSLETCRQWSHPQLNLFAVEQARRPSHLSYQKKKNDDGGSTEWGWLEADRSFRRNPKAVGTMGWSVHGGTLWVHSHFSFDAGWWINPNLSWIRFRLTYACLKIEGSISGILTWGYP